MRVLVVTNMYPSADRPAYGAFVKSQVESLYKVGIELDVLFIDGRTSNAEYLRCIPRVQRAVQEESYALVHAHYGLSGWVATWQRRLPIVLTYHGDDLLGTPQPSGRATWKSRVARQLGLRAGRGARRLVVQSREMLEALPTPLRDRARVLPMGVDLERFRPRSREECCRELGLDPKRKRILFLGGRTLAVKRFSLAAASVMIVHRHERSADLHVVEGEPPERIPLHMNASDVLLLTSRHEGSPMVVKEALACGLPVVSVNVGDVAERLEGVRGCYVVEAEPEWMAGSLERVLGSDARIDGQAAVAELSLPRVAQRLLEVYREAVR